MKNLGIALLLGLLACSKGPTTPKGPLGEVDLTGKLPAGVSAPAKDALELHESEFDVCGSTGNDPAKVKAQWWSFSAEVPVVTPAEDAEGDTPTPKGPAASSLIAKASLELTNAVGGLTVKLGDKEPVVGFAQGPSPQQGFVRLELHCIRKVDGKDVDQVNQITLRTDGEAQVKL